MSAISNNERLVEAVLRNSKARQARVLYHIARDFKDVLPSKSIGDLINKASQIISGSDAVNSDDIGQPLKIPTDEVDKLKELGFSGQVLKVRVVK